MSVLIPLKERRFSVCRERPWRETRSTVSKFNSRGLFVFYSSVAKLARLPIHSFLKLIKIILGEFASRRGDVSTT